MNRIELETTFNEGRNWLLQRFQGLNQEEMR